MVWLIVYLILLLICVLVFIPFNIILNSIMQPCGMGQVALCSKDIENILLTLQTSIDVSIIYLSLLIYHTYHSCQDISAMYIVLCIILSVTSSVFLKEVFDLMEHKYLNVKHFKFDGV